MAHPVYWPKRICFYPIGNTTPTCFTSGLAPEDKAEILLLACGDPRSILFTVHSDHVDRRQIDITCCDWEPAVLARNILLFTMIADGIGYTDIWTIFYDFFLDQTAQDILLAQCRSLVEASPDVASWKKTKYACYLRFCTSHTLLEIRRHWILYIESINLKDIAKESLKRSFVSGMKSVRDNGMVMGPVRAAGPLLSALPQSFNSHKHFWSTGITTSNTTRPYPNPTFAYCQAGNKFNVHYVTDPLQCFHLSPALTSIKGAKLPSSSTINPNYLLKSAMDQFSSWCSSFKKSISLRPTSNVVIRFFVGESLSFGRALLVCHQSRVADTNIYTHPWGGSQINFDVEDYIQAPPSFRTAPLTFNVINTSNLADHAGLLNLLIVTVPLLQRKPSSVIHTDTLLPSGDFETPGSTLSSQALVDIPTLCLLLDIAPSQHLSHFTTCSNAHELIVSSLNTRQFLEPMAWKIPSIFGPHANMQAGDLVSSPQVIACDANKLAQFLFSVYLKMFSEEKMPSVEGMLKNMDLSSGSILINSLHYMRSSLVLFFKLVKSRVNVDWAKAMEYFFKFLHLDRTLIGGFDHYQDLLCHLYLYDLLPVDQLPDVLRPQLLRDLGGSRSRFQGWRDLPVVVCVVLKIPRSHLKPLENIDDKDVGTPTLQCESFAFETQGHNIHSSIQPIFGDIEVSLVDGEPRVSVKEDLAGLNGNSPLIVSFYIPTWIILKNDPHRLQIGLHLRVHPTNRDVLASKLGPMLALYSTDLRNQTNIHIIRHRPDNYKEFGLVEKVPVRDKVLDTIIQGKIILAFDSSGTKATTLTMRDVITDMQAANYLLQGAAVSTKIVADNTILVAFENHTRHFVFPFPIQENQILTRIARKSRYIEIEACIRPDFKDSFKLSLNPFATAYYGGSINLQNIHYLNLDHLPALLFSKATPNFDWIATNVGASFSAQEREYGMQPNQGGSAPLVNLKETITRIFAQHCDLIDPEVRPSVFGLRHPTRGVYALIFVNDIRLDVAANTVVADAYFVPIHLGQGTEQNLPSNLYENAAATSRQLKTFEGETRLWMKLFPVLAERCRMWRHSSSCEYFTEGFPITLDGLNASPLCSCGRGKNLGTFSAKEDWKPFSPEATRIALGPLFTYSLREELMMNVKENLDILSKCSKCRGPGKPTILACSRCKAIKYCSKVCQKSDWKAHKPLCNQMAFLESLSKTHSDLVDKSLQMN